jgi:hypothetical protein
MGLGGWGWFGLEIVGWEGAESLICMYVLLSCIFMWPASVVVLSIPNSYLVSVFGFPSQEPPLGDATLLSQGHLT